MKKYKILIIDDERQLADLTKLNFPEDQFITETCYNGTDGIIAAQKNKPDLILLDVVMPIMDGWDTLLKLRDNPETINIPIIMCTGKDSLRDIDKSFRYGAQAYVMKPVIFKQLLSKVIAILKIESSLHDLP